MSDDTFFIVKTTIIVLGVIALMIGMAVGIGYGWGNPGGFQDGRLAEYNFLVKHGYLKTGIFHVCTQLIENACLMIAKP